MSSNRFDVLRSPSPSVASSSTSSVAALFQNKNNKRRQRKHKKQNKHFDDFTACYWFPAKGWLKYYRCAACKEIMTRKEPSKTPQVITACGHITCANCIVKSYLIDLEPLCPVKDCGVCVNPDYTNKVMPAETFESSDEAAAGGGGEEHNDYDAKECECGFPLDKCECYIQEYSCSDCGLPPSCCYCEFKEQCLDCGLYTCPGDCNTLMCGCVEYCKRDCGMEEWNLF